MAVRPYCAERLKLTKSTHQMLVFEDLVGEDAAPYLSDFVSSILRTDGEFATADEVPHLIVLIRFLIHRDFIETLWAALSKGIPLVLV